MTPELQHRLESSMPPFNGACVHSADELTLSRLRKVLAATITALSTNYPDVESFHDWHEHDGYVVDSKLDSWKSLNDAIETERTLFDSRNDDFDVRIAVYPPTYHWLLRYNIDQDDETDYNTATCDFDLSFAMETDSSGVVDDLLKLFPDLLVKCESRSWFKSNYGG